MSIPNIILKVGSDISFEQIVDLYNSVGWLAYTTGDQKP
jgi:hypothetical protein